MSIWTQHGVMSRRGFLHAAAGLGGSVLLGACSGDTEAADVAEVAQAGETMAERIGVQLYTVRDQMERDFEGTLERVAAIGYREVEFAGYFERAPEAVRATLDWLDLRAPSTHVMIDRFREDRDGLFAEAERIGHEYLIVPALAESFRGPMTLEQFQRYAAEFNQHGAAARERGLRFGFHNHWWELLPLEDGRSGLDVLLAETDPELVEFELDLLWTSVAGRDPVELFRAHPGRFPMWHVKDIRELEASRQLVTGGGSILEQIPVLNARQTAVGEGEIGFARIFEHAELSGLKHFFVENDAPEDSIAQIGVSRANLVRLLS